MHAFERVSRAIQRLCNGYTSLPGLVEWSRANAARLEVSGGHRDDGTTVGRDGDADNSSLTRSSHAFVGSSGDSVGGSGESYYGGDVNRIPLGGSTSVSGLSKGRRGTQARNRNARDHGRKKRGETPLNQARSCFSTSMSDAEAGTLFAQESDDGSASSRFVTRSMSSASAASLPGRVLRGSSLRPTTSTAAQNAYLLPKMNRRGLRDFNLKLVEDMESRTRTAGYARGSSGGTLSASEYGRAVVGSAWEAGDMAAGIVDTRRRVQEGNVKEYGRHPEDGAFGDGNSSISSSVAGLLEEERAFRRRNNVLHR